jgi:hypothetical protein
MERWKLKMEIYMKVNGKIFQMISIEKYFVSEKEKELLNMPIMMFIKENGINPKKTEKVLFILKMEIFLNRNGKMM